MRPNLNNFEHENLCRKWSPKKSELRLYLAREKVCPDILEQTEKDANVLKNMLAGDENFIFQHDQEEKRQPMQCKMPAN
jgi:hypothetical protein